MSGKRPICWQRYKYLLVNSPFFSDNQQAIFSRGKVNYIKEDTTSFVQDIEELWIDMYERGFIEEADVANIQGGIVYYFLLVLILFAYK